MRFSSEINRPPYEAEDAYLQITSGCSHSKCKFCTFYKDAKFKISPIEEVEEDIKELSMYSLFPSAIDIEKTSLYLLKSTPNLNIAFFA